MDNSRLPFLSVSQTSELIRTRQVSPVEVVEAYLRRIEDVDPSLNAYITVAKDQALKQARLAEESIGRGDYLGPMHGIPTGLKDQICTKDMPTTNGSTLLRDFTPKEDATVVSNLKKSGAVILGKLNMGEFAGAGTFHRSFGVTRNPWNPERSTGGSSSGSAAAVIAGLCATSLGEDTGGSIRSPASFCGAVGLRPTWGRVSRHGVFAGGWSMDTAGPISRTVEDCSITLAAIAGPDPKDPYTGNMPVPDYRSSLEGDIKGLRVGLVRELTFEDFVAPEVKEAVLQATEQMSNLGASVQEVSIPLASYGNLIMWAILYVEATALYRDWSRQTLLENDSEIPLTYLIGSLTPAQIYYKAQKLRELMRRQVFQALEQVDVLVSPTVSTVAPPIDTTATPVSKESAMDQLLRPTFIQTPAHALAGIPALSVPCGFSPEPEGMPIGLQIGGRPYDEATVLKAAYLYEQSSSWHVKKPDA